MLVLLLGLFVFLQPVCQPNFWAGQTCSNGKWASFLNASPNEVGDTLAGFAGALAFVWLITTVWLQSQELSEQRQELAEQRIATQKMAKAQIDQFNLISSQQEDVNQKAVLLGVQRRLEALDDTTVTYTACPLDAPQSQVSGRIVPRGKDQEIREFYLGLNTCLEKAVRRFREGRVDLPQSKRNGFGGERNDLYEAYNYLDGLIEYYDKLSLAGKMYRSDLKVDRTSNLLREVIRRIDDGSRDQA